MKMKEYKRKTERYIDEQGKNCVRKLAWDGEILHTLAKLEDKIENGTLIELPCRVGDVIYYCCQIKKVVEKHVVTGFDISKELSIRTISDCYSNGNYVAYFYPSYFNKTLFKNKVDADTKLKEFL